MAGSNFRLAFVVLLAVRSCCSRAQGGAHSLRCIFNITSNEQQRCVAKVFMDRTLILEFDCYHDKVISEKQEVMATIVSKDMKGTLKDVGDKMRRRLPDLNNGKIGRESSTLQVWLECRSDANGIFCRPWEFLVDGQRFLVFDLESGAYKADNPIGEEMREKWQNDTKFLKMSVRDCKAWLRVLVRENVLGTTAAPAAARGAASPPTDSATPATAPGAAPSSRPVTSVIPVILTCLVMLCLL